MKAKEFADRMSKGEKFYDTVSRKIVTILEGPDITGETHGMTDSGEIIKVNAKNLEATDEKSSDKRSDTEKLANLLDEMGINPEEVSVHKTEEEAKKILDAIEEGDISNTFVAVSSNRLMRLRQGVSKFEKTNKSQIEQMIGEDEIGGIHYSSYDESKGKAVKVNIYIGEKITLRDFIKLIENEENHAGYDLDSLRGKEEDKQVVIRYKKDGTIDEVVPLLENDVVVSNKEELLQLHEEILELSKKRKGIKYDSNLIPDSIEEATIGEVTAPNFGKAITDMANAVKGEVEVNKDGVTQADE